MKSMLTQIALVTVGLLFVLSRADFAAEPNNRRTTYADYYGPLTDHNIFMKERPVKPKPTSAPTTAPIVPTHQVEESLVLRGVTMEDNEFRAYVEDLDDGKILKLVPGDSVGRGQIAQINMNTISYEHNGELDLIAPGEDFTGKEIITLTATTGPTTGPSEAIDPNDPNLTIEQKLKLRRLQESNK